jgi:hypothetical protein
VRFALNPAQKAAFRSGAPVTLGFDHPRYGHAATIPANVRQALSDDLTADG